jgi:hypothetical protein
MGLFSSNSAVTEVLSTVLLLVIAAAVFGSLSYIIINSVSSGFEEPEPMVSIVGFVENNVVILEHRGGYSLSSETTEVSFTIGDENYAGIIKDFMDGSPSRWSIGQRVFTNGFDDLSNKRITALVIDTTTGSILFNNVIRTGFEGATPTVETLPATYITQLSAVFNMRYHFYDNIDNAVRFRYRKLGDTDYQFTNWVTLLGKNNGVYEKQVPLNFGYVSYIYRAEIRYRNADSIDYDYLYGSNHTINSVSLRVGIWYFDELGGNFAYDSSENNNDGKITGDPNLGIEGVNNTAFEFNNPSDIITVAHSNNFNFHAMSISSWIKPYSDEETGYAGEIKPIIAKSFEPVFYEPDIVHVKDDIYAIAYRDSESNGYVSVARLDKLGNSFEILSVDNHIYDKVVEPDIIQIRGEIFAIVWGDPTGSKLYVTTIRVTTDGSVHKIKAESIHFGWSFGRKPSIRAVKSESAYQLFAISSGGGIDQGGGVTLVKIYNNGLFDSPTVSSHFNMQDCSATDIIFINRGYFAVVYSGTTLGSIAVIQTFRFDDGFLSHLASFSFSIPYVSQPCIIKSPTENRYVISFSNTLGGSFLTSVSIDQGGLFPPQHNPPALFAVGHPSVSSVIKYLGNSIYAIAYSGGCDLPKSLLITVEFDDTAITNAKIIDYYHFEYAAAVCDIVAIQESDDLHFAIIGGTVGDCEIYESFFTSVLVYNEYKTKGFFIKEDAYELRMTDSKVIVFLNGQELLSGSLRTGSWNFVTFTYKFSKAPLESYNIFLYVDGTVVDSGMYNQEINNNNELVMGGFVGVLDEVILYRDSLSSQQVHQLYQKYV